MSSWARHRHQGTSSLAAASIGDGGLQLSCHVVLFFFDVSMGQSQVLIAVVTRQTVTCIRAYAAKLVGLRQAALHTTIATCLSEKALTPHSYASRTHLEDAALVS